MKKNIGKKLALYPTPTVVVGTMVNSRPNYALVGHVGIIGHDRIMVSLAKAHYTNAGIRETGALTVSIVDEGLLKRADYIGCVSGHDTDKSGVFQYEVGETGSPIIKDAPVVIECKVDDVYETDTFESFICKIEGVHAEEEVLTEKGTLNYKVLKPVLFEMPTYEYLRTGDVIGRCKEIGKDLYSK